MGGGFALDIKSKKPGRIRVKQGIIKVSIRIMVGFSNMYSIITRLSKIVAELTLGRDFIKKVV